MQETAEGRGGQWVYECSRLKRAEGSSGHMRAGDCRGEQWAYEFKGLQRPYGNHGHMIVVTCKGSSAVIM